MSWTLFITYFVLHIIIYVNNSQYNSIYDLYNRMIDATQCLSHVIFWEAVDDVLFFYVIAVFTQRMYRGALKQIV